MPFLRVDWSRFSNSADPSQIVTASRILGRLQRPLKYLLLLSGLHLDYTVPKKRVRRYLVYVHRAVVGLVALLVTLPVLLMLRFCSSVNFTAVVSRSICLTCLYVQAATSMFELIYLGATKRLRTAHKLLHSASTGVGVLRQQKPITRSFYTYLTLFSVTVALWTAYNAVAYFTPILNRGNFDNSTGDTSKPFDRLLFFAELDPLVFCVLTYLLLCWFLVHIYLCLYASVLLVELRSLNSDLRSDPNLYQAPVLKHYFSIHFKLRKFLRHFNRSFSHVALVLFVTAVISCLAVLSVFVSRVPLQLNTLLPLIGCLLTSVLQIVLFSLLGILIEWQMTRIRTVVCALTAADKNLEYEIYSLSLSYVQQMHDSDCTLSLGLLLPLSRKSLPWIVLAATAIMLKINKLI